MQSEEQDIDWLFSTYHDFFALFEMSRENLELVYQEWKETDEDTVKKYYWAILEKLLHEAALHTTTLEGRYFALSLIYNEIRNYKQQYEADKANNLHKKHLFYKLKFMQVKARSNNVKVRIMSIQCCAYCGYNHGEEILIEEALEQQLVPSQRCIHQLGCNCYYTVTW
jgi:hypothetical protein